jgi:cell division protein FtsB
MDGLKKKRRKLLLAGICVVAFALILYDIFFGKMGLVEYFSLRSKYEVLEQKKVKMEEKVKELKEEEYNLRENLNYIEEIARKELGLVREREKIIILENEPDRDDDEKGPGNQ